MNSVFSYYLAWILLSYVVRQPWLLLGLGVLLVLQRFLPSPGALLRLLGRARSLRGQVSINRANITARRDLAVIYLEGRRARSAVPLLEEGLALAPNDAELLYLLGLALQRVGRPADALVQLVRAVEVDARVRYGLPYVVAGDALAALKRWEEALDAYERYLASNSSDVSAYTKLARAKFHLGDPGGARETLKEGLRTWGILPASMKRRQLGRYLGAHWARVSVLREPAAIAQLLLVAALLAIGARFAYQPVLALFHASAVRPERALIPRQAALADGFARCGSQDTGAFRGRYTVRPESLRPPPVPGASPAQLEAQEVLVRSYAELFSNFEIEKDRIVSGPALAREFCLTRVFESSPNRLIAEAVWHDDLRDPNDAALIRLSLTRSDGETILRFKPLDAPPNAPVVQLRLEPR